MERLIGFGSTGEVWRAHELATGDVVALKRLRVGPAALADRAAAERLQREAALLAAIRHAGSVFPSDASVVGVVLFINSTFRAHVPGMTDDSVAALLVAGVPTPLVATARYCAPFRLRGVAVTVRVADVAPLYGDVFVRSVHVVPAFVDTCH